MADDAPTTEPHEEIETKLSDYHDGTLPEAERAQVEAHLAGCEACRAAQAALEETLSALSAMGRDRAEAPPDLSDRVTESIHRRSAGRFFARKTLGDRVPFGVLLVIALVVLAVISGLLYSSRTGSLRYDRGHPTQHHRGGAPVVPGP
jgi:anti-sigma factor RsiW